MLHRPLAGNGAERASIGFAEAMLGGDVTAALAYFDPDSRLLTPDLTEVAGRHGIGALLTQLTASGQRLEIQVGRTVQVGELALATQFWRLASSGRKAEPFERRSRASLVLRVREGRWGILIASPWG